MADHVTPLQRSKIMARVGSHDTGPELLLRHTLHRLGFRYRTNYSLLPGRPDLVFPKLKKVIFVHGCFWHGHSCPKGKLPQSRLEYWAPKILGNQQRDRRVLRQVRSMGWKAIVVWQCELKEMDRILPRVLKFLKPEAPKKLADF